jgi:hypothetical protein
MKNTMTVKPQSFSKQKSAFWEKAVGYKEFWLNRSNPTTKKYKYHREGDCITEASNGSLKSIIQDVWSI